MDNNLQINQNAEQTYHSIRQSIVSAQHRLSAAVNSTMVITYWEIGEQIYKACGENDRAEYGKKLLQYLCCDGPEGNNSGGMRKNAPKGCAQAGEGRKAHEG